MVPADAAPHGQRLADTPADLPAMSVGQLAHELNSLLDGSLRTLGLALRQLEPTPRDDGAADAVVSRLQAARDAMWQMAELLERAMRDPGATSQVLSRGRLLGDEIPRVLAQVGALAESYDVAVRAEIAPEARKLPAGPLGAVLLNGLRNAVQACIRGGQEPGRVELAVGVERRTLWIRISDNGAGDIADGGGSGPGGHGVGLDLCRQVVSELGGTLRLEPGPGGVGALLRVEVPVRSLPQP